MTRSFAPLRMTAQMIEQSNENKFTQTIAMGKWRAVLAEVQA